MLICVMSGIQPSSSFIVYSFCFGSTRSRIELCWMCCVTLTNDKYWYFYPLVLTCNDFYDCVDQCSNIHFNADVSSIGIRENVNDMSDKLVNFWCICLKRHAPSSHLEILLTKMITMSSYYEEEY